MSDETVVINKSTYNKLLGAVIVLLIAFSFAGGYILGGSGKVITTAAVVAPQNNNLPAQPPAIVDVKTDTAYLLGNKDAKVKIVEFSDFQCPFCGSFFTSSFGQIKKDYIDTGKVTFYLRNYPLPFHQNAEKAAEAAECAGEQGKFWEYHDVLFGKQSSWSNTDGVTDFKQYASDLKLDTAKFNSCLDTDKYKNKIAADINDGNSYGVSGTPTFYINGKQLVGAQPYSVFQQAIDSELA